MEQETQKPNFFKSLIMSVIILAIIVVLILGFGIIDLPSWPFIFFLFYYTTIAKMEKEKLMQTSIGGFIGMTVGFLQSFIILATGNETAGLIGLLVVVTVLIALMIDGRTKLIETFCMLMVTVLTGYTGSLSSDRYIGCALSYIIAVVLFVIVFAVRKKYGK